MAKILRQTTMMGAKMPCAYGHKAERRSVFSYLSIPRSAWKNIYSVKIFYYFAPLFSRFSARVVIRPQINDFQGFSVFADSQCDRKFRPKKTVFPSKIARNHCVLRAKALCRMKKDTVSNFKIDASCEANQCVECPNATHRPEFITSRLPFPLYFAPKFTSVL